MTGTKQRIVIVHGRPEDAGRTATRLQRAGFRVEVPTFRSSTDFRPLREDPPDLVLIDLTRRPSHGREAATQLRRWKDTRSVPLLFLDGDPEKVDRIRAVLPDAHYAESRRLVTAVRRALRQGPADPVVPPAMAGYATDLAKKLGIKEGSVVRLVGAPKDFETTLGELPEGARVQRRGSRPVPVVLLFTASVAELERRFDKAADAVEQGGSLWLLWPKKASGVATDLTQQGVREHGLERDWVDYKVASVDATWSGLRFARRG